MNIRDAHDVVAELHALLGQARSETAAFRRERDQALAQLKEALAAQKELRSRLEAASLTILELQQEARRR